MTFTAARLVDASTAGDYSNHLTLGARILYPDLSRKWLSTAVAAYRLWRSVMALKGCFPGEPA